GLPAPPWLRRGAGFRPGAAAAARRDHPPAQRRPPLEFPRHATAAAPPDLTIAAATPLRLPGCGSGAKMRRMWRPPEGRVTRLVVALWCLAGAAAPVCSVAAEAAGGIPGVASLVDVPYATVGERTLLLDLHLPAAAATLPPLVVYLHGGAWRSGDKAEVPPFLVQRGYAVASLDFRSSERSEEHTSELQ